MKVRKKYEELHAEEHFVMQIRDKKTFDKVIKEIKPIIARSRTDDNFWYIETEDFTYKNVYFILGKWRNGMVNIRNGRTSDREVHICSDHKASPMEQTRAFYQIDDIIDVLDKYDKGVVFKRLQFNEGFVLSKV